MNPSVINREKIITKFNLKESTKKISDTLKTPERSPKTIKTDDSENYYSKMSIPFQNFSNYKNSISLNILSCLPSPIIYDKICCNDSIYNTNVLNSKLPLFKSEKTIQICIYKIVNRKFIAPFLLILLYKNSNDKCIFPNFKTSEEVSTAVDSKLDIIYQNLKTKPEYIGYRETQHNIYLFYKDTQEYNLTNISKNDKWWWATIFEIVNDKKILNFNIERSVYSIFYKEPILTSLFNKKNNKYSSGNVLYFGASENYISFIASLGLPKESPTSNLGPYYYFYTYVGAGRRAIWTQSRKSEEYNGELITRNEYGLHIRGGLVRFILFGNTPKYFLNREDDLEDKSDISQDLAKESSFIKETLKIRDVDGNWAINHDIAYIGSTYISTDKKHKPRKLYAQWAAKDYYQYTSLSYHYINTDIFSNVKDKEEALNAPFELTNYDIE